MMGAIEDYKARNAAREARRAEKQKPPEKRYWWFNLPNPIDRFTGWLVAWTAMLFLATVGNVWVIHHTDEKIGKQAEVAEGQLQVMQSQLEAMQRDQEPRLMTLKLEGPTYISGPGNRDPGFISWKVAFTNSGKGAAIDVSINTYMSLDYAPFVRSNSSFRPEPIRREQIGPGESEGFAIVSRPVTKAQFDALVVKDLAIEIFFEFVYQDVLQKQYIVPSCLALLAGGGNAIRPVADCRKMIGQ
jgi:hypothetical protein